MRLIAACVAGSLACLATVAGARHADVTAAGQTTSAPPPSAPQTPPQTPRPPVFRSGVDVIQLDVSVLDKDHHPVHGLTAANFTVKESGKLQRLVGVSEVALPTQDDLPAAWLHLVPEDVETNGLGDRLRDSRLFVIVMDDANVPFDDEVTIESARQIGRAMVNRLGPLDVASVVYTRDAGLTQDFTSDRARLLRAIDAFQPRVHDRLPDIPPNGYPTDGDLQRHDNANRWSRCEMSRPSVPTLLATAQALAQITDRRKTIVDISTGEPSRIGDATDCVGADARQLFWLSQRANVNIYTIDPAGLHGTEAYVADRGTFRGRPPVTQQNIARGTATSSLDFLAILSENTGGDAIIDTNDFDSGLDRIYEENGSYYLLGYQSTNMEADGKYRKLEVKVDRPDATVRARRGYFGPTAGRPASSTQPNDAPTPSDANRIGLGVAPGLTLRVALAPFVAPDPPTPRSVAVAVTLGLREPAPAAPLDEVIDVITSATRDGHPAVDLTPHRLSFTLAPTEGNVAPYEWTSRLDLPPGHYEVRLNAHSRVLDRSGSVYGEVDVPDFGADDLAVSGVVFGVSPDTDTPGTLPLAALMPVAPTTERSFVRGEHVTAFLRVYEGGTTPIAPVGLKIQILDAKNAARLDTTQTLDAARFGAARSADYALDLSTLTLEPGPHLLAIQALRADGSAARRDVPFSIR